MTTTSAPALILSLIVLLVSGASKTEATTSLATSPVHSAESFVDSVGVNTHLGYTGTVYDQFGKIRNALDRLGVHYIRDGVSQGRPDLNARYRALAAEGIKLDALVGDPLGESGVGTVGQQLSLIARQLGPGVVASLEGPNEFDNVGLENWLPPLRRWVKALWYGAKKRPTLRSIPIIGPILVNPDDRSLLGDISQFATVGNMHPYPGGNTPDEDAHMESEFELAAINTPGEPVQATETGYTTSINATDDQPPISERAEGIYMPRLLLDDFRRGIDRTYIYELIDVRADPGRDEGSAGYGLLRHDFSPKPAYRAVRNLLGILSDPGPSFEPKQLDYLIEGAPPETRQVLLQKRDGSYYLMLWDPVSIWNAVSGREAEPAAHEATLQLAEPITKASLYEPNRSQLPFATNGGTATLRVPIGPRVSIVELVP